MIAVIIISGLLFVIGNITWPLFNEQKVLYVPQALFFISLLTFIKSKVERQTASFIFICYFLWLARGNLVKQVFYTDTIKQVNDYIWGALVTGWLLFKLKKHLKWATLKTAHGGKK